MIGYEFTEIMLTAETQRRRGYCAEIKGTNYYVVQECSLFFRLNCVHGAELTKIADNMKFCILSSLGSWLRRASSP